MPLAKIREERARLLRDDDDAVLPGSPTTRQRAPGGTGALWFVLYAIGGTLYVALGQPKGRLPKTTRDASRWEVWRRATTTR